MSTDEIDALLERYLHLLDQYTALRTELGTLQSSIHQDIARANFSSDRGIRYGQDYYDSRMRASRLIQLTPSASEPDIPTFTTISPRSETTEPRDPAPTEPHPLETPPQPTSQNPPAPRPSNPLTMFGILVPPSLRAAQKSAISMVEDVIPQLASTDAEMRELEIQIRRARKRYKRELAEKPMKEMSALEAMATRDGPPPPGVLREGPAPAYVEVRFAEEWE